MRSGSQVPLPPMLPGVWGTANQARPLGDEQREMLAGILGVEGTPAASLTESPATGDAADSGPHYRASDCRLNSSDLGALSGIVGPDGVSVSDEHRLRCGWGKSTLDLLTFRQHQRGRADSVEEPYLIPAPDAVIAPSTDADVLAVLEWASENNIAVVPFGGGSSVTGGLRSSEITTRAVIALDLVHFDQLVELDEISGEAVLGAGLSGPKAEELLGEKGWSLGHFPQSFEYATIGGFAMTGSSGQNSSGYGRFEDMVTALTLVTPSGIITTGHAPASASGPDLRRILLNSEGTFGVCTQVRVRVHPVREAVHHESFRFDDFVSGAAAMREIARSGLRPTVVRLNDETETAVFSMIGDGDTMDGCEALVMVEGDPERTAIIARLTADVMTKHGAKSLGSARAEAWEEGRFSAPFLRDSLLDCGALCETLETVTSWSNVDRLKKVVSETLTDALTATGSTSVVLCHISHIYPTGASLYFTIAGALRGDDPREQWAQVKDTVTAAIVEAGGAVSHHHGVGRDHRDQLAVQLGDLGVDVLRSIKNRLDPAGIMNPGALLA